MSNPEEETKTNNFQPPPKKTVRKVIKVKAEVSHAPYVLRDTPDLCVIMIDSPDLVRYKPAEPDGGTTSMHLVEQKVEEEVLDIKTSDPSYYDQGQFSPMSDRTSVSNLPAGTFDWLPAEFIVTEVNGEYICGYVRTEKQVDDVLRSHARYTESFFSFKY